ncbi:MAG: FeoB-associated Cys-rich membrane protein [Bacteroidaceae bacterium]|nr:FeoB-associated Cys-rich membrane protein [Bacteroidaceae bacterium]
MFNVQSSIVYLVIAATAFIIVRHIWRQVRGRHRGCNCGSCGSCPANDGKCCCTTTHK